MNLFSLFSAIYRDLFFSLVSVFLLLPRVTCAGNFFQIAKLRDCEIAREKTSTENYYRLRGRAAKCSHGWHGWRRRLPCLVGSSPTGDAIFSRLQDCEVARSREKYFFAPVAERGTSSARQWTVCRVPLITGQPLPGAPFFETHL